MTRQPTLLELAEEVAQKVAARRAAERADGVGISPALPDPLPPLRASVERAAHVAAALERSGVPAETGKAGAFAPVTPDPVVTGEASGPSDHRSRVLAHSSDRVAWLRARSRGITATEVAKLSSDGAVRRVVWDKLHGTGFGGNAFTEHGRAREPQIARWVLREHGIRPSDALFHAADSRAHLATPDGLAVLADGTLVLSEIKTTSKPWRSIPRGYLRQVWWQQYVLGAERTLVVWEQHDGFVPVAEQPECRWVDRDDSEIHQLVRRANLVLTELARG